MKCDVCNKQLDPPKCARCGGDLEAFGKQVCAEHRSPPGRDNIVIENNVFAHGDCAVQGYGVLEDEEITKWD